MTLTSSLCDALVGVSGVLVNVSNCELSSGTCAGINPELTITIMSK